MKHWETYLLQRHHLHHWCQQYPLGQPPVQEKPQSCHLNTQIKYYISAV